MRKNTWRISNKAHICKVWIIQLDHFLTTTLLSKVRRRFFQILWPSQKTQTLTCWKKISEYSWTFMIEICRQKALYQRFSKSYQAKKMIIRSHLLLSTPTIFFLTKNWSKTAIRQHHELILNIALGTRDCLDSAAGPSECGAWGPRPLPKFCQK